MTDLCALTILTSVVNMISELDLCTYLRGKTQMDRSSTLTFDTQQTETPASHLRRTYEAQRALFQAQPQAVQRFLESQADQLAEALVRVSSLVRFNLPDKVFYDAIGRSEAVPIPVDQREQKIGGIADRMRHTSLQVALSQRLTTLELSPDQGVATSAALIRYTTATAMVRNLLPSGRSVRYQSRPGEEIPNQPVVDLVDAEPHSLATGDNAPVDQGENELSVPYVPEARRFFLPQWVAFDDQGQLLVNTINEARAHIASMQAFLGILRAAASLAPYILADAEYQQRRYGIIGQLVNQGRLLARFETNEIIDAIQRRVKNHILNRGLSLSLPYFDDQDMELKNLELNVIPAGRVMFVPAFLVLAISSEEVQVAHNNWMSASTRQHLLAELKSLRRAFDTGD